MPLAQGNKLGPYEIVGPLGSGGMGEVYRARDSKLKREVALKVLPESFANDGQRMLRFEREAQVLASLNHTNLAHVYGVEEVDGVRALVMELVEGLTLAERIAQGPVPLEEAVPLAKQIAEGLEYAHERGIIHRDLKPANIKVTPEGQVKILDFGLAKALSGESDERDISTSPTISIAATSAGVLLGTAGYMSPEQAKGKAVDRRADIWAFGCVLYEMLAGKAAFEGETITDRLAAVVRAEPELEKLPEKTPGSIREMLRRCLIKDPKQRLQAIGEARIALENWMAHPEEGISGLEAGTTRAVRGRSEWLAWGAAAVCTLVAAMLGILHWGRAPEKPRVIRAHVKATLSSGFLFSGQVSGFALSPDGLRLAYVALNTDGKAVLWVRPLDTLQAQPLPGTEDASFPFWSPDSRSIGFFAGGKLKRVEASGGPPMALCDAPLPRGGTWSQAGVILFAPNLNSPLFRVSASGGTATAVTSTDPAKGEVTNRWPQFLPDGNHFLYLAGTPYGLKENPTNSILVGSLDSKGWKFVVRTHAGAMYASGNLLFLRQNTLMAQPFDLRRLELTGEAIPIADPVREEETTIRSYFSVSNGLLAYLEGTGEADRELVWVDRSGKKVGGVLGQEAYSSPRISPDGKKIIFTRGGHGFDIWSYDVAHGIKTPLTFGTSSNQSNLFPVWSPDNTHIAYTSVREGKFGFYERAADGSGSEKTLMDGTDYVRYLNDWSPDGKFLAFQDNHTGVSSIFVLPLGDERTPRPVLQSPAVRSSFSSDGKWMAYCSIESGNLNVYVVPFPGPGGKWQISSGGGDYPRWRRDGKEIFYLSLDGKMMSTEVKASGSSFAVGPIKQLFETRAYRSQVGAYDVTADGQRFILSYEPGQPNAVLTLVENWDAELKKK
jgi:serine/threonine protein kinase